MSIKENEIRRKLDDPDIEITRISEDSGPGIDIYIEFQGNKQQLKRLIEGDFYIYGDVLESKSELTAVLRPEW
ncbi:MAG: hypothetical protein ACOCUO_03320 [archaeon]